MSAPATFTTGADSTLGYDLTLVVRPGRLHQITARGHCWSLSAPLLPVPLFSVSAHEGGEALAGTDTRPESRTPLRALLSGLPGEPAR